MIDTKADLYVDWTECPLVDEPVVGSYVVERSKKMKKVLEKIIMIGGWVVAAAQAILNVL